MKKKENVSSVNQYFSIARAVQHNIMNHQEERKHKRKEYQKQWREAHKVEQKAKKQQQYRANKEAIKARIYASRQGRRGEELQRRRETLKQRCAEAKASLGGRCEQCSESDARVLQFRHVDSSKRLFCVTKSDSRSLESFLAEVTKCELLCANCRHLKMHYPLAEAVDHPRVKRHRSLLKEAKELLGGCCTDCGLTDFRLLQFDHTIPDQKLFNVADAWVFTRHNISAEDFFKEVAKCQLRCANCHHIKTHYTQ